MHKLSGGTIQLAILLTMSLLGGCATPTHWIDVTGQSRPDWQFQQAMVACQQQEVAVEQQYENQLRSSVASARNEHQAAFVFAAAELTAVSEAKIQFNMCMTQSGWAKRKIDIVPSRLADEVATTNETTKANTKIYATKFITIPPKAWREFPSGKVPDTLSFVDDKVAKNVDGVITANVMMNYDRPNKIAFIGTAQSVLFNVAFRCDSDKAKSHIIEFYSGTDARGSLLKQVRDFPIHIKPDSVESRMQNYVCSTLADI